MDGVDVISGVPSGLPESIFSDGISGLPEPVLHDIMSFLLVKDAARMATTCKKLNHVFSTLPYLDLGYNFFPIIPEEENDHIEDNGELAEISRGNNHEEGANSETESLVSRPHGDEDNEELAGIIRRRRSLIAFVDQTLAKRKRRMEGLSIHKFRLGWIKLDAELRQRFDWWICYLVHCNIKELVLQFTDEELELEWYDLPRILLTATSLRSLTLARCRFPSGPVTFSSLRLRKLSLEYVYLDDKILLDIINTCPDLEDLYLCHCRGFKEIIHLPAPSQLRFLHLSLNIDDLYSVKEVVVEAQYLEKLTYTGAGSPAKVNIITNFEGNLKILILYGVNITNKWFCELMSRLTRLQELSLGSLNNLESIEISSSSLERLKLYHVFTYKDIKFGEFLIDTPNLVYFNYSGSLSCAFRNTSLAVKEVVLTVRELCCRPKEQLCNKLMPFLQKFACSEHVTLTATFETISFPVETRVDLLAPLTHIKHLTVQGYLHASPLDALEQLLESLLWIAPNLDTLSIRNTNPAFLFELFIKFSCEYSGSGSRCCDLGWECLRKYSSPHLEFEVKCEDGGICRFLTDSFTPVSSQKRTCEMASE